MNIYIIILVKKIKEITLNFFLIFEVITSTKNIDSCSIKRKSMLTKRARIKFRQVKTLLIFSWYNFQDAFNFGKELASFNFSLRRIYS